MNTFIKAAIFTIIISLGIGSLLAFYQNNDHLNITVEAYDSVTHEPLKGLVIYSAPSSTVTYDEDMAGRGRNVIDLRHFWFAKITVSVEGYKDQTQIVSLIPNKTVPFYLESKDPSIYDKYTPEELKNRKNKYKDDIKQKEKFLDMGDFFSNLKK